MLNAFSTYTCNTIFKKNFESIWFVFDALQYVSGKPVQSLYADIG